MTLTQITEKGIKDGEIIDADINTNSGISGSKVSLNFGSQNISTTGNASVAALNLIDNSPSLIFTDSAANSDFRIRVQSGILKLRDDTNSADRLTIDSSGRVGIGLQNPQSLLELNAANDVVTGIQLGRAGDAITASRYVGICQTNNATNLATNSGFSGIEFGGPSSTREAYLAFHTHDAGVGSGERMCIDKSGQVGIGTASPDRLIHGAGATPILKLDSTNNEAYVQLVTASPSNTSYIGLVDSDIIFQTSGDNQSTVSKLKIDNNGHLVIVDGNLEVASGHGIDFSNVSDGSRSVSGNLLDDYEEGTFTPEVTQGVDNGSGGSPTYAIQNGNYVKIGRLVQVSYFIQLNTTVGTVFGTGARLHIGGLPFTIQAISNQHNGFGSTAYHTIVSNVGDVPITHYGSQHNTNFECYHGSSSMAPTNNTDQYGRYFIGGFTYHTNA